jgi:peptidoglycan hydrolase-like protein with peptidoglycan-binding domain
MKHPMRRLLIILMICLLLPGLSLGEAGTSLPDLTLTDYPASTSTSHVTITFIGGEGFTYVLDHQYKSTWLAPLTKKLTAEAGFFEADCLPGTNKFVLRNSGKGRSDETSITFTIKCTDTAGAPDEVQLSTPTLRKGATGAAVKALQRALKDLGVYSGSISGTFDTATRKAVIAAQKQFGIAQDGVVGPVTLRHLDLTTYSVPVDSLGGGSSSGSGSTVRSLQKGMQGSDVRTLQSRLKALGYDPGPVDGVFGDLTLSAVLKYQKNTGLLQDGIVGPATRKKLNSGAGSLNPDLPNGWTRYLKMGSKGSDVKTVQSRLIVLDYLNDKADGIFGKLTHRAVVAFQFDEGIEVDGIVGPVTYGRLFP